MMLAKVKLAAAVALAVGTAAGAQAVARRHHPEGLQFDQSWAAPKDVAKSGPAGVPPAQSPFDTSASTPLPIAADPNQPPGAVEGTSRAGGIETVSPAHVAGLRPGSRGRVFRLVRAERPVEGTITEIRIEGLVTISEEEVRREIHSQIGHPWNRDDIEEDLKRLSRKQWFSTGARYSGGPMIPDDQGIKPYINKDPKGNGVILTFVFKEMPVLKSVEFRGRTKVTLQDIETTTGLKAGARAEPVRVMQAVNQIKNLYDEKGYELAEVQLIEGDKAGDTRAIFEIDEGPKNDQSTLSEIRIVGLVTLPEEEVRREIHSRVGHPFNRDDIDEDLERLSGKHWFSSGPDHSNGPFILDPSKDEQGIEANISKDPKGDGVILTFVIKEMPILESVEFRGRTKISVEEIEEATGMKAGARADTHQARRAIKPIRNLYDEAGYEFAKVRLIEGGKEGDGRFIYEIDEGPKRDQLTLAEIRIEGLVTIPEEAVRREILSRVGQPWSRDRIEEDLKWLRRKQWFSEYFEYVLNGHDDRDIFPPRVTRELKGNGIIVTFSVREMPVIRSVEFRGRIKVSLKAIEEASGMVAGARADHYQALLGREAIRKLYMEEGYEFAKVRLIAGEKTDDGRFVYEIDEGPKGERGATELLANPSGASDIAASGPSDTGPDGPTDHSRAGR